MAKSGPGHFKALQGASKTVASSLGLAGHHFKKKEALLQAVAEVVLKPVRLPQAPDLDPLLQSFSRSLERARLPTTRLRVLLVLATARHSAAPFQEEVSGYWRSAERMIEAHLRCGRDAGTIRTSVDPKVVAPLLAAAMIGQALLATEGIAGLSTSQATDFLEMLRLSLRAGSEGEPTLGPTISRPLRRARTKEDPAQPTLF